MSSPSPRLTALLTTSRRWRAHEHLPATPSTNAVAAERARAGAASGLIITTDHQTAGRGRLGRRWTDLPTGGSLPVSLLVDAPAAPTLVPLATGLAAVEAIGLGSRLKWPNDVLVETDGEERKIAGILVESVGDRLVIGVGTNLDWRGVEREGPWTSIAELTGEAPDAWNLLADLLEALERRLGQLETDPALLREAYRRGCTTLGRRVRVALPAGVLVGDAEDIDASGALLVRTGAEVVAVNAGDVQHLRTVEDGPQRS